MELKSKKVSDRFPQAISRQEVTEIINDLNPILQELTDRGPDEHAKRIKELADLVWVNRSWQLTKFGFELLSPHWPPIAVELQTKTYREFQAEMTPKVIIGLNRYIAGPWFFKSGTMFLWNPEAAFEFQLSSGNVRAFCTF